MVVVLVIFLYCLSYAQNITRSDKAYQRKYDLKLKNLISELSGVDEKLDGIIAFEDDLEKDPDKDVDNLTVKNPNYWKALLQDSFIYYAGAVLRMRKKNFKNAMYLLVFSSYHLSDESERLMTGDILMDISVMENESNMFVQQGIASQKKGDIKKALEFYDKALKVYPNNSIALYQIGLVKLAVANADKKSKKENIQKAQDYFTKAQNKDPFMYLAYQGKKSASGKVPVL